MLAKRKYPLGEKEKKCIEAYGQMILKRADYKRKLLQSHVGKAKYDDQPAHDLSDSNDTPKLNDSKAAPDILEERTQQSR